MRVLVTGSRNWGDPKPIVAKLDELLARWHYVFLYHGDNRNPNCPDAIADQWARRHIARGDMVAVHRYPANWREHGRSAGPRRNQPMVTDFATHVARSGAAYRVLAYLRDDSPGTTNCINLARRAGLDVEVTRWEDRNADEPPSLFDPITQGGTDGDAR